MHAWEAIQKSVDYIEEHLTEEISIEVLAGLAGLSAFYFQRLFSRLVKKPVMEYCKLRKLALAAGDLKEKKRRIMDVAIDYGFSSHANFTRVFKETYGITPEEYRTSNMHLNHFVKPELILSYAMIDEGVPLITDSIVLEVNRRRLEKTRTFVGIAREISVAELTGGTETGVSGMAEIWDDFHDAKTRGLIPQLIAGGNELGVLSLGDAREGFCTYMAGGEAAGDATEKGMGDEAVKGLAAEGYTVFELPVKEYVICGFEAESFEELVDSAIYKALTFMDRWMKEHGLTVSEEDFAAEMYYPPSEEAVYMEEWMIPRIF